MLVAMFTTFAAGKKEPLAEAIARIHAGFLAAGFGEPSVRFSPADGLLGLVDRVARHSHSTVAGGFVVIS